MYTRKTSKRKRRFQRRLIKRQEARRQYKVNGCPECRRIQREQAGFGPRHEASPRCESGKQSHCTCDVCF